MSDRHYPKSLKRLSRLLPDRLYLQLRYFSRFHRLADLKDPKTYNEKLQWLKLNYRIESDALLVDKYEVKRIVANQIGDDHVIPTLGVYDHVDEIDYDSLPDSFVLKCTHDSGGLLLVEDKKKLDTNAARRKLSYTLSRSYYYSSREPHYLKVRPRIIAEPFLVDDEMGQLADYKFFCFDGEVKSLFVATDRTSGNVKFDYYDADFNPLSLRQPYPNSTKHLVRPQRFAEMLDIARTLSKGHPHVRVDLYQVNNRIYFGELTFFHFGGMQPFKPAKWDRIWGDWLRLPAPVFEY